MSKPIKITGNFALDNLTGNLYAILHPPVNSIFIQNYNIVGYKLRIFVVFDADKLPGARLWVYRLAFMPPAPRLVLNTIFRYNARKHAMKMRESQAKAQNMPIVDVKIIEDRQPVSGVLKDLVMFKPTTTPILAQPILDTMHVFSNTYSSLPIEKNGNMQIVMWPMDKLMYKGMPKNVEMCISDPANLRATEPGFYSTKYVGSLYINKFEGLDWSGNQLPGGALYSAKPIRQLQFVLTSDPVFCSVLYSKIRTDISAIIESDKDTITITKEQFEILKLLIFEIENVQLSLGIYCDIDEQLEFLNKFTTSEMPAMLAATIKEMKELGRFINTRYRINNVIHSGLYHDIHRISFWTWIDTMMVKSICKRFPGIDGYINIPVVSFAQYGRFGNDRIELPYLEEEVALCSQIGAIEWVARNETPLDC